MSKASVRTIIIRTGGEREIVLPNQPIPSGATIHNVAMTRINATETRLTGKWLSSHGHAIADETCQRISELVTSHLEELGRDSSGWEMSIFQLKLF